MKIIFAGTPVFAACALESLIEAGHEIVCVLTQPDRPAGRGMKMVASAVKLRALKYEMTLLQPQTFKSPVLHSQLEGFNADVMVVAAYGLILPKVVLNIPRYGCLNIHASLLPRWRGAAPIHRAIQVGDRETGITIMQMDAGLDTGALLLTRPIPIAPDDTTQVLHDKLCTLGALSIKEALILLQQGKLVAIVQDEALACYAPKIKKAEAEIDWRLDADRISQVVRAFNPSPGAYTQIQGNVLKIWQVKVIGGDSGQPGEIVAIGRNGITVACGRGSIILETVQKAGGRKLNAAEFLTGYTLQPGDCFNSLSPR
ncbi:MAG: methionyl-tRNA formyltransferase [Nitrosomonas sp.]|nr:methionyl-tRNA formyltransferase [Nitrosomonas sp.]MDP1950491.1 methionyl-tRNA formyltransferase [Nitrosomonas sp.]